MKKQEEINRNSIVSAYMNTVLSTGEPPKSVYLLAKEMDISERDFYKFFTSFEELEKKIFVVFFEETLKLLNENEDFKGYNATNKILSFYFTFIEILTENRSFVQTTMNKEKNALRRFKILDAMKSLFFDFVGDLEIETLDLKQEQLEKLQAKSKEHLFWIQFLMIVKFWLDDTSPSFEKTDIFIEKTVHASFDVLNVKPIQSFLELGKFLFKEKVNFKM